MSVSSDGERVPPRVVWHASAVRRKDRPSIGGTIWLTGLSASGKSTIASAVEQLFLARGISAYRLDGDNLRHGLNADLGFTARDRTENVRRVGAVAQLFADSGAVAVAALISPFAADRARIRAAHTSAGLRFVEVFVDTPLGDCEHRDPKGMYARARAGEIEDFTGISSPYEPPLAPDLVLTPHDGGPARQAARVLAHWLDCPAS